MIHPSPSRIRTIPLPVLLLAAALTESPLAVFAQSPGLATGERNTPAAQQLPAGPAIQSAPTAEEEGDSYLGHQRYQAAIEAYKRSPQASASVWTKMGVAYQLLLDTDDAQRCYQQAHRLDPRSAVVLNNLGSLAMSARQYPNAEKLYSKAVKLEPHNALYSKNLGTAYLADHHYKKGWESYRTALSIDPNIFSHTSGVRVENPSSVEERGALNYYMAKGCLLAGKPMQAIEYLRLAMNEGYLTPKKLLADSGFSGLHDMPAFQDLMASNQDHH